MDEEEGGGRESRNSSEEGRRVAGRQEAAGRKENSPAGRREWRERIGDRQTDREGRVVEEKENRSTVRAPTHCAFGSQSSAFPPLRKRNESEEKTEKRRDQMLPKG